MLLEALAERLSHKVEHRWQVEALDSSASALAGGYRKKERGRESPAEGTAELHLLCGSVILKTVLNIIAEYFWMTLGRSRDRVR